MSTTAIDHVALGLSRVAKQYEESPKFRAFLTALLTLSNQVEETLNALFLLPSIDDMGGVNLDVIGDIVGVSRTVSNVVVLKYFGFEDTGYYATCFGEEGIPNIGSRFYEEGESFASTTLLQDPEFRLLIRAKIVKNSSTGRCEDIIKGIQYLFNTIDVRVLDNLDMSISISIGRPLYAIEQAMLNALDILPRPAGVRIDGAITSYTPTAEDYAGGDSPIYGE
jgi:hypothetical protein